MGGSDASAGTLLFDVGGVLLHFDFGPMQARLAPLCPGIEDPLDRIAPLKEQLECGSIDGDTFVQRAVGELGFRGSSREFGVLWANIFTPNLPMWEAIERANGQYRLLLFSNTSDIHHDFFVDQFPIFRLFEGGLFSYRSRRSKPDPEFFQLAIDELGLDPRRTLYVDDREENVAAGARAGFVSLRYDFNRHVEFLDDACAAGFPL